MMQEVVIVLIVLAVVAVASVRYMPKDYFGSWKLLADEFTTQDRPKRLSWREQHIHVYSFAWTFRGLMAGEYAKFDLEVSDDGLWMVYDGPQPHKAPDRMLIPWRYFRVKMEKPSKIFFEIAARRAVQIMVQRELGEAILRQIPRLPATTNGAS
jgi:hypothetical protein